AVREHRRRASGVRGSPPQLASAPGRHLNGEVSVGHLRQPTLELAQRPPHTAPHHGDEREDERDTTHEPYHCVTAHTARGGPQRALSLDQVGPGDAIAVDPALLRDLDESIDGDQPGRDVRTLTLLEPGDDLREGAAETRQGVIDACALYLQRRRDQCNL